LEVFQFTLLRLFCPALVSPSRILKRPPEETGTEIAEGDAFVPEAVQRTFPPERASYRVNLME
jgi:hypothetical protein